VKANDAVNYHHVVPTVLLPLYRVLGGESGKEISRLPGTMSVHIGIGIFGIP
jgi:hypothetical protein